MGLNRFDVIIDCEKYVRLYIACGNLIVTEDQEQNLQSQTQHLTDNVRTRSVRKLSDLWPGKRN